MIEILQNMADAVVRKIEDDKKMRRMSSEIRDKAEIIFDEPRVVKYGFKGFFANWEDDFESLRFYYSSLLGKTLRQVNIGKMNNFGALFLDTNLTFTSDYQDFSWVNFSYLDGAFTKRGSIASKIYLDREHTIESLDYSQDKERELYRLGLLSEVLSGIIKIKNSSKTLQTSNN